MAKFSTVNLRGDTASRPAAGVEGRFYTDTDTDELLRDNGTSWDVVANIAPTPLKAMIFATSGVLSTGAVNFRVHAPDAGTISNVTAAVGTAPTGASLIVDVNKNGTTIFTTQSNRPTITAAATEDLSAAPDITSFAQDDVFTVEIDQVGSTVAGGDLIVQIRYN